MRCHRAVMRDADRAWLHVSVDDRCDVKGRGKIAKKVESVRKKVKGSLKT